MSSVQLAPALLSHSQELVRHHQPLRPVACPLGQVEGTNVPLVGGYDKWGKGRKPLANSLAATFLVTVILIKGKQAVLEPGTVFDAQVQGNTDLELEAQPRLRRISLGGGETLVT